MYVFDYNGLLYKNQILVYEDVTYLIDSDGVALPVSSGWNEFNGEQYYVDETNSFVKNQIKKIGEFYYYFDTDGKLVKSQEITFENAQYKAKSDGKLYSNEWDGDYYYTSNGSRANKCVLLIDGLYYGFRDTGTLYKNTDFTLNGNYYRAKSNGRLFENSWYYYSSGSKCYFGNAGVAPNNQVYTINDTLYLFGTNGMLSTNSVRRYNNVSYISDGNGIAYTASNGWNTVGAYKYYFDDVDSCNYAQNITRRISDYLYSFDGSGRLRTNTTFYYWDGELGLNRYFRVKEDGVLCETEWYTEGNYKYYYGPEGESAFGVYRLNGVDYLFEETGRLIQSGDALFDGTRYISNSEGVAFEANEGWNEIDGKYYYCENGFLVKSSTPKFIDGYYYGFASNGERYTNTTYQDNYYNYHYRADEDGRLYRNQWYVDSEGNSYYYGDDCKGITNVIKEIESVFYGFDYYGRRYTDTTFSLNSKYYRASEDGRLLVNQWYTDQNGYKYYYVSDGSGANGLTEIEDKLYLFNSGRLQVNSETKMDGVLYVTSAEGIAYTVHPGWNEIEGYYYYCENNSIVKNQTKLIGDDYYGFDSYGRRYTNQSFNYYSSFTGEYLYYRAKEDGTLIQNEWYTDTNGYTYYYGAAGRAVDGVVRINSIDYLFNTNGRLMRSDTRVVNNVLYISDYDGVATPLQSGWNTYNGNKYYVENNALISNQIKTIDNEKYYFDGRGVQCTNYFYHPSDYYGYYFGSDGAMVTNTVVQVGNNYKYMFGDDGNLLRNSSMWVDNVYYESDDYGRATEVHLHSLVHVDSKDASCEEDGHIEHWTCEECGKNYADEEGEVELSDEEVRIQKLEHTPSEPVVENEISATCTHEGLYDEVVYCAVCHAEISRETKTTEINPNAHVAFDTPVRVDVSEPTCAKEGVYVEITVCKECGKEISRETKYLDKLPHTPAEQAVIENVVEATCAANGSYDEVVYCTVCHEELSREAIITDKTNNHTRGEAVIENKVNPVKDDDGNVIEDGTYDEVVYCTVCDCELERTHKTYTDEPEDPDQPDNPDDPQVVKYGITISTSENGYVTSDVSEASAGDTITLSVFPAEGYGLNSLTVTYGEANVVSVSGNTFVMPEGNVTIVPTFEPENTIHQIHLDSGEIGGSVFANRETAIAGEEITLTVIAGNGYKLKSLVVKDSDENTVAVENNTFVMPDKDVTVTAVFEEELYDITVTEAENGTISVGEKAHPGDVVQMTITANVGYEVETVKVLDSDNNEIPVTGDSFIMPVGGVTVSATYEKMDPTIIAVYRYDVNGKDIAVDITGTGIHEYGETITLTAPKVDGYNFVGWFRYSAEAPYYTGEALCGTNAYMFRNTKDMDLVAVYEALGNATLTINGGSLYTLNGETMGTEISTTYTLGTEITLYTDRPDFAYWKNSYGKILSRNRTYTFTVVSTDLVYAVFNTVIENKATLIFESLYGQVIARNQLGTNGTMNIPSLPFRNGYDVLGWDMNGDGTFNAESDTLQAAIERGLDSANETNVVTILPIYELKDINYSVTINGGSGSGEYRQNSLVNAVLDETQIPAGKKFSHWEDETGVILSYSKRYSFFVGKNEVISAIFVDESETVEAKGTTAIVNIYKDTVNKKMSFVSFSSVPEGCKIQQAGVIATTDSAIGTSENFNDSNAAFVRGNSSSALDYEYTWTKGSQTTGLTWYVRAYLRYMDASGNIITTYGDLVIATY